MSDESDKAETPEWIATVREKIERGWQDSQEGKLVDAAEVREQIRLKSKARRKARLEDSGEK